MAVHESDVCVIGGGITAAMLPSSSRDVGLFRGITLIAVVPVADEKDKTRRRRAPTGVRSEKIRALAEDC